MRHRLRSLRADINDTDAAKIQSAFWEDPAKPLRLATAERGFPFSTKRKVFHKELGMFPYRISFLPQLLPDNCPRQLPYAQPTRFELRSDSGYLDRIGLADECVIYTSRVVEKHIFGVRGHEDPHNVVEVSHTSQKAVVRCDVHTSRASGPHFSSGPAVTSENYKRCFATMLCAR